MIALIRTKFGCRNAALWGFRGWGESFFGDLHAQAHRGVEFYTQTKVVVERWPRDGSRKF